LKYGRNKIEILETGKLEVSFLFYLAKHISTVFHNVYFAQHISIVYRAAYFNIISQSIFQICLIQ